MQNEIEPLAAVQLAQIMPPRHHFRKWWRVDNIAGVW